MRLLILSLLITSAWAYQYSVSGNTVLNTTHGCESRCTLSRIEKIDVGGCTIGIRSDAFWYLASWGEAICEAKCFQRTFCQEGYTYVGSYQKGHCESICRKS